MPTSRERSWRRFARIATVFTAGVLTASVFVNPALATSGLPKVITYTRATTCHGLNFHPLRSKQAYSYFGSGLVTDDPEGDWFFVCQPDLPNKAVVTRVAFTFMDASSSSEFRYCALVRSPEADTTAVDNATVMAQVQATGVAAEPGSVRFATTVINNATVNNDAFGYWLQCQFSLGSGVFLDHAIRLYGATVDYHITATNG